MCAHVCAHTHMIPHAHNACTVSCAPNTHVLSMREHMLCAHNAHGFVYARAHLFMFLNLNAITVCVWDANCNCLSLEAISTQLQSRLEGRDCNCLSLLQEKAIFLKVEVGGCAAYSTALIFGPDGRPKNKLQTKNIFLP